MRGLNSDIQKAIDNQLLQIEQSHTNTLNLQSFNISDLGVQYICTRHKQQITIMKLGKNGLSCEAALHLSSHPWRNLFSIELSSNKISDRGCRFLAKGQWKILKELWLFDNDIGETGASHLSKGDWKDLILLHLSHNQIKSGLESLIKGNWKDLKKFYIRWNQIDFSKMKKILRGDWTTLKVLWLSNPKRQLEYNLQNDDQKNAIYSWINKKWSNLTQLIIW